MEEIKMVEGRKGKEIYIYIYIYIYMCSSGLNH